MAVNAAAPGGWKGLSPTVEYLFLSHSKFAKRTALIQNGMDDGVKVASCFFTTGVFEPLPDRELSAKQV